MASAAAVPSRSAVACLTISSYCRAIRDQLIGRVMTGLSAGKAAEREGHGALPVAVDVGLLDFHLGAVAEHALHHGRRFRGGAGLELRVDAGALALDVPVDHHAAAAVPGVPLGHQVLVPGAELLGIRGARRRRALAPDTRVAGAQGGVDHASDRLAQVLAGDEAPPNLEQVLVGDRALAGDHALEAGVGAEPVQAEKEALLECRAA